MQWINNLHVKNIKIINQLGQQIYVQKKALNPRAFLMNLSNQGAGIYFIQFENDKELVTKKIVITK